MAIVVLYFIANTSLFEFKRNVRSNSGNELSGDLFFFYFIIFIYADAYRIIAWKEG